jgi:uncharacterized protein (DUF433 family)
MQAFKYHFNNVNDWVQSLSEDGIEQIDKDLILQHLRSLYDMVYQLEISSQIHVEKNKAFSDVDRGDSTDSLNTEKYESEETESESILQESALDKNDVIELDTNENVINSEGADISLNHDAIELLSKDNSSILEHEVTENHLLLQLDENIDIDEIEANYEPLTIEEIEEQLHQSNEVVVNDDNIIEELKSDEVILDTILDDKLEEHVDEFREDSTNHESIKSNDSIKLTNTNNEHKSSAYLTDFKVWNKDIRTFIGINDKFNFIAELFNGNAEAYETILNEINLKNGVKESLLFLEESGVTTLYDWKEDGFSENAFVSIINQYFNSK